MIEWKLYDPKIPPEEGKRYLISDGSFVDIGQWANYFDEPQWYPPDRSALNGSDVVYYAEINLPICEVTK